MCSAITKKEREEEKKKTPCHLCIARSLAGRSSRPKKLNRMRFNTHSHLAQEENMTIEIRTGY
jgi:hypothetical protein